MKEIYTPRILDFERANIRETVCFLRNLYFGHPITIINLSKTKQIADEVFMSMFAQTEKAYIDRQCKYNIVRSNDFYVNKKVAKYLGKTTTNTMIHARTNNASKIYELAKDVNPIVIDREVQNLRKIGIVEYYERFSNFLTEIIGNATEHGIKDKAINWWLWRDKDQVNKRMKYAFVDMGTGIITSYKKAGLPFRYWFKRDSTILLDALNGKLGSSTKQENRGRGLPAIREMVEKGFISDFRITTNNISLHYENGEFVCTRHRDFVGTFIAWSIDRDNFNIWKQSL